MLLAESYSFVDALFGTTMWRLEERGPAPPPPDGATVDVFITTYDEPVDMVTATALAAEAIRYPHETWVLDDGAREEMREAAEAAGIGYLTRSEDWKDRPWKAAFQPSLPSADQDARRSPLGPRSSRCAERWTPTCHASTFHGVGR